LASHTKKIPSLHDQFPLLLLSSSCFFFFPLQSLDTLSLVTPFCSHFHFGPNKKRAIHIFCCHGASKIHSESIRGWCKTIEGVVIGMYNFLLPTNQPITSILLNPIHQSIDGRMKVHWVQKKLKNVRRFMLMTIMMMIRDVRDPRNKCVRFWTWGGVGLALKILTLLCNLHSTLQLNHKTNIATKHVSSYKWKFAMVLKSSTPWPYLKTSCNCWRYIYMYTQHSRCSKKILMNHIPISTPWRSKLLHIII
jgi:hypothetical protein